ncbi:Cof-type HAD-IIB family hydrolase [Anaerobium acetethylicum]|uniref:Cof subfamily of IIB subfamily of haloacid dehalogenase superfamily/HAD-superfamily hydrolase, subfamily IIB n=1 Tax=Anaerobium acetethylicum TaxID=1619234 RepID=A0A1D3TW41_9FIRM|nr:Cof-type HAD-IIB family hydrolase [Anaerobium acetethylicum]SCP98400.1 hypothetical protein SAMN05421730_102017 [Anaerobium acetethylicum]
MIFKDLLLVSDLDDTLLNSDHFVSQENLDAINYFTSLGGLFTVATGRTDPSVRLLNLPLNTPAILYNGSVIYDYKSNSTLWHFPLDQSAKSLVYEILNLFSEVGIEIITLSSTYILAQNEQTAFHMNIEKLNPIMLSSESTDTIHEDWQKIIIAWDPSSLAKVKSFLDMKSQTEYFPFKFSYSYPIYIEIINNEANKGVALKVLSDYHNIPLSQCISIGDNDNDLELINNAGIGIAVANAKDIIKQNADYICSDNDNHILVDVINYLSCVYS